MKNSAASAHADADQPLVLMLDLLAQREEPIGAATIYQAIGDAFPTSEATIGRWLRELDRAGFTLKHGRRGRTITQLGRSRLADLRQRQEQLAHASELVRSIGSGTVDKVQEVLEARLLLETEIVRAAAQAISDEQIAEAEEILRQQERAINASRPEANHDIAFHDLIGRASGKTILAQTLKFIRTTSEVSPYLRAIRMEVHPNRSVEDHAGILRALKRRSPRAAVRAMRSHIENLMEDVRLYRAAHGANLG